MKRREKTTKTKVKGDCSSKGPRYSRDQGWGYGHLALLLIFLGFLLCFLAWAATLHIGNFGFDAAACGHIEISPRHGASTPQQTIGTLGPEAEPGVLSSVLLWDRLGQYEVNYTVPSGCWPGAHIAIEHFY
mmetsp:Transcript_17766/g.44987  ORF Transcript_17766/g.44987 Transcript_17766/m.44987 type:complete len:131 (+) Transcript_17766:105-497(+)